MSTPIPVARTAAATDLELLPALANRHGLITGATGTGKTVTLQVLAEGFSRIGVPTFMADVKGDLAGLAAPGVSTPKLVQRLESLKLPLPVFSAAPVTFWDLTGQQGHPVRTTVSDMGPLLFGRLFNLNETQRGVLTLVFKIADDNGLLLLDLKDLRAMLQYVGDNAKQFTTEYGNISAASIGAIQRSLLSLEEQGGAAFFGEPMLDIDDLIQTSADGRGMVNILAADKLMTSPRLYSTFLLWMLSELFERMPEVGDPEKPKLVFFFDEAHLLFSDAPDALVEKIEQVVRLIRSKGIGVYFITQNPLDIPDTILSQLGNRVQHALRAFTPRDQKAVKTAAQTLRANPKLDTEQAIGELATGEALISFLEAKGNPAIVERAWILPPASRIGPLAPAERGGVIGASVLKGHYEQIVDRESAYEKLHARAVERSPDSSSEAPADAGAKGEAPKSRPLPRGLPPEAPANAGAKGGISDILFGSTGPRGGRHEGMLESAAKSAARSVGSGLGRSILRGMLGSMFGGKR